MYPLAAKQNEWIQIRPERLYAHELKNSDRYRVIREDYTGGGVVVIDDRGMEQFLFHDEYALDQDPAGGSTPGENR